MKKQNFKLRKRHLLLPFLFIALMAYQLKDWNRLEADKGELVETLNSNERKILKSGDLIFRQGFGFVSDLFAEKSGENLGLSHIGVIEKDSLGLFVWHSLEIEPDTVAVHRSPINDFLKHAKEKSLVILRDTTLSISQVNRIIEAFDVILNKKLKFDHSFEFENHSKIYCTELVHWAWKLSGINSYYDLPFDKAPFGIVAFLPIFKSPKTMVLLSHNSKVLIDEKSK